MPENRIKPARDSYYDNLRFLLIFVVVLHHSLETMWGEHLKIAYIHEALFIFCMPLFVFVTGFFAKSMADAQSPKRMRILNYILLYVIFQPLKMVIGNSGSFLSPSYGNWFLVSLIAWYTVLPAVAKMKPPVVMVLSILAALLVGMDPKANAALQISRTVCFFPFFMMGFYLTGKQLEILKKPKIRLLGVVLYVAVALFYVTVWRKISPFSMLQANKCYRDMKLSNLEGCALRLAWYVLASAASFGIMCMIPGKRTKLTEYGSRTLPIYVIHMCLYLFLAKHTEFFATISGISNRYLLMVTVLLYTLAVTILCGNAWFKRAFDWLMRYDFRWLMKKE